MSARDNDEPRTLDGDDRAERAVQLLIEARDLLRDVAGEMSGTDRASLILARTVEEAADSVDRACRRIEEVL